jgi:hypothetical protein
MYNTPVMNSSLLLSCVLFVFIPSTLAFFDVLSPLQEDLNAQPTFTGQEAIRFDDLVDELLGQSPLSFGDVESDAWYERYVHAVAQWQIVSGYKNSAGEPLGLFGPGDQVTIAEMLKMALKAAQVDETQCTRTPIHPHAQGHWAYPFVSCAEQRNMRIMQTYPHLDSPARRYEVLVIMHDAFTDHVPALLSSFDDSIDHPYEGDIAFASVLGVVSGDQDTQGRPLGTFRPNDAVNRAEAAKIIYEKLRTVALINGEPIVLPPFEPTFIPTPQKDPTFSSISSLESAESSSESVSSLPTIMKPRSSRDIHSSVPIFERDYEDHPHPHVDKNVHESQSSSSVASTTSSTFPASSISYPDSSLPLIPILPSQ